MIVIDKIKTMFAEYPDIVSVEDLMEMLGVGKNTAYKLINEKKIKSVNIGRIHKIPKYCVIDYIMKSN